MSDPKKPERKKTEKRKENQIGPIQKKAKISEKKNESDSVNAVKRG